MNMPAYAVAVIYEERLEDSLEGRVRVNLGHAIIDAVNEDDAAGTAFRLVKDDCPRASIQTWNVLRVDGD